MGLIPKAIWGIRPFPNQRWETFCEVFRVVRRVERCGGRRPETFLRPPELVLECEAGREGRFF